MKSSDTTADPSSETSEICGVSCYRADYTVYPDIDFRERDELCRTFETLGIRVIEYKIYSTMEIHQFHDVQMEYNGNVCIDLRQNLGVCATFVAQTNSQVCNAGISSRFQLLRVIFSRLFSARTMCRTQRDRFIIFLFLRLYINVSREVPFFKFLPRRRREPV